MSQVKKQKEPFSVTIEEKELKLAVERPKETHKTEAQKVYNRAYRDAIESGAITRPLMETVLRRDKLWDDEKQKQAEDLQKQIAEVEKKIAKRNAKLTTLKEDSLKARQLRFELRLLLMKRNELDNQTAEAQAENARFNRLVSLCTVYNDTGKPYFSSYQDYLDNSEGEVAFEAASRLAAMVYNLDPNYEANLPENKFLKEWGLVDDKLRLINEDGHLVDTKGRLIDDKGRLVDEDGKLIDNEGNYLDEEGNYVIEEAGPVLDDDGNPIQPPSKSRELVPA